MVIEGKCNGSDMQYKRTLINDQITSDVIVFHLYIMYIKNMLVATNDYFRSINSTLNMFIMILIGIAYFFLLFKTGIACHFRIKPLVLVIIVIFYIVVCFLLDEKFHNTNNEYLYFVHFQLRLFVSYCIPLFIAVSHLTNTELLLVKIYRYLPMLFAVATLCMFFVRRSQNEFGEYSMSYGNAVAFIGVFSVIKYKRYLNKIDLLEYILCGVYIFVAGSRGPLVCLFAAFFLMILVDKKRKESEVIFFSAAVAFAIIIFMNLNSFINLLTKILSRLGFVSRNLILLQNNIFFSDSGRGEIHRRLLESLNKRPLIGLGAFGAENAVGETHGLYLDIIADFGYILGIMIIVLILYKTIRLIRKNRNTAYGVLLIAYASLELSRGFFAGSVWGDKDFWILLGLLFLNGKFLPGERKEEKQLLKKNEIMGALSFRDRSILNRRSN